MTEPGNREQSQASQFSLGALLVVTTAVAALFGQAGARAILLLPLLLAAGFLIALGRLVESHGWDGAGVYLLRFALTGAASWATAIAILVVLWLMLFSLCGYDEALTNSLFPRAARPWVAAVLIGAMTWFFSARRWAYRGCWACPAVLLLFESPRWISASIAGISAAPTNRDLREAGLVYLFAAGLFIAGLLGERRRNRAARQAQRPQP